MMNAMNSAAKPGGMVISAVGHAIMAVEPRDLAALHRAESGTGTVAESPGMVVSAVSDTAVAVATGEGTTLSSADRDGGLPDALAAVAAAVMSAVSKNGNGQQQDQRGAKPPEGQKSFDGAFHLNQDLPRLF